MNSKVPMPERVMVGRVYPQCARLPSRTCGGILRTNAPYRRYFLALIVTVHIVPGFLFTSLAAEQNDEQALIQVLQSGASLREKDAACARIKRFGTEQSIPALSALLGDEQLSHSARYALESMPFSKAGAALIQALENTSGLSRIGIINSLGVRREPEAVSALEKLLAEAHGSPALTDEETLVAVAAALGQIATPAAIHALESAPSNWQGRSHEAVVDGLLRCANRLLARRDEAQALTIFSKIYKTEKSESFLIAAYCGMIRASGERGLSLQTTALAGKPGASQTAALQLVRESNVPGATQAYAKLLSNASPLVQLGLIDGLAQRDDSSAAPAITALTHSSVPEIRVASLKALGSLGDGSAIPPLAEAAASGAAEEQATARQALLTVRRGNPTTALLALLETGAPAIQAEAARALGERSESAAVPKLLQVAHQGSDSARKSALRAIALLVDEHQTADLVQLVLESKSEAARVEAAEALGAAYQQLQARNRSVDVKSLVAALTGNSTADRIALMPVCSSLADPQLRQVVRAAITESDTQLRAAAIRSICDSRDPELLPDLVKIASGAPEENFRALATAGFVRLSSQEAAGKLTVVARLVQFKTILASSPTVAQKRMLLAGLAEIPDPEALELSERLLDETAVQAEAARAVIKLASTLPGAAAQSRAPLKKIVATTTDTNTRQAAEAALKEIDARGDFITTWRVVGPYRQAGKNYADLFDIAFPPETATSPTNGSGPVNWQVLPAGGDPARPGVMDLLKPLGGEQCVAYVRTRVYSPQQQPARLELGSDDGVKVWLNGELVHAHNIARPLQIGSDKVNVTLKAGWNMLVMKVTQNNLGWEFCARLLQPDGSHLEGLQFAADQ